MRHAAPLPLPSILKPPYLCFPCFSRLLLVIRHDSPPRRAAAAPAGGTPLHTAHTPLYSPRRVHARTQPPALCPCSPTVPHRLASRRRSCLCLHAAHIAASIAHGTAAGRSSSTPPCRHAGSVHSAAVQQLHKQLLAPLACPPLRWPLPAGARAARVGAPSAAPRPHWLVRERACMQLQPRWNVAAPKQKNIVGETHQRHTTETHTTETHRTLVRSSAAHPRRPLR